MRMPNSLLCAFAGLRFFPPMGPLRLTPPLVGVSFDSAVFGAAVSFFSVVAVVTLTSLDLGVSLVFLAVLAAGFLAVLAAGFLGVLVVSFLAVLVVSFLAVLVVVFFAGAFFLGAVDVFMAGLAFFALEARPPLVLGFSRATSFSSVATLVFFVLSVSSIEFLHFCGYA